METAGIPFSDHGQTMLPSLQLSLHSDLMNCVIGWCRFVSERTERLSCPVHRHSMWELHYVTQGNLLFRFEDREIPLPGVHFILIPPGAAHSIESREEETVKLVLGFQVKSSAPAVGSFFQKTLSPQWSPASAVMKQILEALALKSQSDGLSCALSVRYILHALIAEAVDVCLSAAASWEISSAVQARRQDILHFIQNHILRPLTAREVAAHMGFEVRQANRICQREFGCSIHSLIVKIRLESLQALLIRTEFSLSDIAEMTGFSSAYAFSRHFKACTGMTPGRYRKMNPHHLNQEE